MITAALGDALRYGVFKVGIGGRVPGRNCSLFCNWIPKFESVCSFFKLVWTHAETFAADVPNYPNSRLNYKLAGSIKFFKSKCSTRYIKLYGYNIKSNSNRFFIYYFVFLLALEEYQ
jgi:hypothetical protein